MTIIDFAVQKKINSSKFFLAKAVESLKLDMNKMLSTTINENLLKSSEAGTLEKVRNILRSGAQVDVVDQYGSSALGLASSNGHLEVVKDLLFFGANVNLTDDSDQSPVFRASRKGHIDVLEVLLLANGEKETPNRDGATPLYTACQYNRISVVRLLISKGADVNKANILGETPLIIAASNGNVAIVEELLAHGALLNKSSNDGRTALHAAVLRGRVTCARRLLDKGMDVDIREWGGVVKPGCKVRVKKVSAEVAKQKQLSDFQISKHQCSWGPQIASYMGKSGLVSEISSVNNVRVTFDDGFSCFWDPNLVEVAGRTALFYSTLGGKLDCSRLLIERGASIHLTDLSGQTALHTAATGGSLDCVLLLTELGMDVRSKDYHGDYPLHCAVRSIAPSELVSYLVLQSFLHCSDDWPFFHSTTSSVPVRRWAAQEDKTVLRAICRTLPTQEELPESFQFNGFAEVATYLVDAKTPIDRKLQLELIDQFCTQYPKLVPAFANFKDKAGRTAISICAEDVLALFGKYIYFCGRYELQHGPPIHCTATSIVTCAKDHGVLKEYKEAFEEVYKLHNPHRNSDEEKEEWGINQDQFLVFARQAGLGHMDDQQLLQNFRSWDKDNSGTLTMKETLEFFKVTLGPYRSVVIKFMSNKDQCDTEISLRTEAQLDPNYVVGILPGPDAAEFEAAVSRLTLPNGRSLSTHKYGFIMPFADRSLQAIYVAERPDIVHVRGMIRDVVISLQHLHSKGIMHGDLKMNNILRVDGKICLTDLDTAAQIGQEFAGEKFSSAILPPEMLYQLKDEEEVSRYGSYWEDKKEAAPEHWKKVSTHLQAPHLVVKTYDKSRIAESHALLPYSLVIASPQIDLWSLGAVLFTLCCGQSLFGANRDDDFADNNEFAAAQQWTAETKQRRLSLVADPAARNLISQLLAFLPAKRPSLERVLEHPFLSQKKSVRMAGDAAAFDVFLSYRVASDSKHVEMLYHLLTAQGVRVWWDKLCLKPGEPWEEGFCAGLLTSRTFVCLMSRHAINHPDVESQNFSMLKPDSRCDNVFLEYRLALELRGLGFIEKVFPVMIGDTLPPEPAAEPAAEPSTNTVYGKFFATGCCPRAADVVVAAVEAKLLLHMDNQALGSPLEVSRTVSAVLGDITACQGAFVEGDGESAFRTVAQSIINMLAEGCDP